MCKQLWSLQAVPNERQLLQGMNLSPIHNELGLYLLSSLQPNVRLLAAQQQVLIALMYNGEPYLNNSTWSISPKHSIR